MAKYYALKYPSSRVSVECSSCGGYVVAKDNVVWLCKKCGAKGRINDLMKKHWEDKLGKSPPKRLSAKWKKLTGEK